MITVEIHMRLQALAIKLYVISVPIFSEEYFICSNTEPDNQTVMAEDGQIRTLDL